MAHRWKNTLTRADATPYEAYMNRRQLMGGAIGLGLVGAAGMARAEEEALVPNAWEDITQYNNFYEFGTGKG
ncbi:MAG: mononuclear molybdenum enzyme YedY, partial [Pseudomonadota bacterium]